MDVANQLQLTLRKDKKGKTSRRVCVNSGLRKKVTDPSNLLGFGLLGFEFCFCSWIVNSAATLWECGKFRVVCGIFQVRAKRWEGPRGWTFPRFPRRGISSLWIKRLSATLIGLVAVLAIVLAAAGIYSVIFYSVTQRTKEVGIRMAFGAAQRDVFALIIAET